MNPDASNPVKTTPHKVLFVDDNQDFREVLGKRLLRYLDEASSGLNVHYEFIYAGTLQEGKDLSPGTDATILDLCLPGSTEQEVIGSIGVFCPPVIVLTGMDPSAELRAECVAKGAANVYYKDNIAEDLGVLAFELAKCIMRSVAERLAAKTYA